MEQRKRIALYGGTFDPVHRGHLAIAERLTQLFALDEVLFIPAHVAPHKRGVKVTSALHRYAMLALSTSGETRFLISTVEMDNTEKPYTIDTLTRLKAELGHQARLFFVMGADSWRDITTWRAWEQVLAVADTIVVTRPGYELNSAHLTVHKQQRIVDLRGATREGIEQQLAAAAEATVYISDAVMMEVSATEIRRRAQQSGADLMALVVPPVAEYIRKYKLYQDKHETEFFDTATDATTKPTAYRE